MCTIKMEKHFRKDSSYCQLFKDIKIGTLIRTLKSNFINEKMGERMNLPELIMSCSCLNRFLNLNLSLNFLPLPFTIIE